MSDQQPSSPSPEEEPSGVITPERASSALQLGIPPTPPSPTLDPMAPATSISQDSPFPSSPPSPMIPTSPPVTPGPPPYKPPRSTDLAYLGSLPTPTVRQLVDPRYASIPGDAASQIQATTQSPGSKLPGGTGYVYPLQGPSSPAQIPPLILTPGGSNSPQTQGSASPPSYPDQAPPSLLPPNAILSSGAREWEGMTNDGVKVHRRDTWIVGQGWGRHLRVIDGLGPRRPVSTGVGERGKEKGAGRHRTW